MLPPKIPSTLAVFEPGSSVLQTVAMTTAPGIVVYALRSGINIKGIPACSKTFF
jgi:hypothetical protein